MRLICASVGLGWVGFTGPLDAKAILEPRALPALVVPDIEGEAHLHRQSVQLRQQLARGGRYRLVDSARVRKLIERNMPRQESLHDCNSCIVQIGRQLGANQLLVTWVQRADGQPSSVHYELYDVIAGRVHRSAAIALASDDDLAWSRVIAQIALELQRSSAVPRMSE
ncbi:MAG TPA: DUF2380 domain-containing protein [Steroidobacteraceae bacterium]